MKRGSIIDVLPITLILCLAIIITFIMMMVWGNVGQGMTDALNHTGYADENTTAIQASADSFYGGFIDYMVPMILFGLAAIAIALSFMVGSHPIFAPISLGLLILFVFLSSIFSNIMYAFVNSSEIIPYANSHPIAITIIQHLPLVVFIIGLVILIVNYSRSGGRTMNEI